MNSFSNLLPNAGANRSPLTDEELQRLASMLQQSGEGLASINAQEAQMLKDAGGSGKPLPGTEGLGLQGGPIRSYDTGSGDVTNGNNGSGSSSTYTPSGGGYGQYAGGNAPSTNSSTKNTTPSYDNDGENKKRKPPPPKYYDTLGRVYSSAHSRNSANTRINADRERLKTKFKDVKSDADFQILKKQNPELLADITELPESEVQTAFDDAMVLARYEGEAQTAQLKERIVKKFNNRIFNASGQRVRNEDGSISDVVATDFADADRILSAEDFDYARLSEAQRRALYDDAMEIFTRENRFTLTTEDVDVFKRDAPEMDQITDITATDIAGVADVQATTVGDVADTEVTTLEDVLDVASDAGELADVIQDEDALIQILKSRVSGEQPSVAEIQLKRGTEDNIKALVSTTTGEMDPAKLRQARNMFMSVQQIFTGQKAELRAAEQVQAEQNLLAVLKAKGTREASIQIADMEKDIQMSIQQGDLDQARRIKDQQAALVLVTTQAEIEKDERLANLDKERILAIEQGKMDLATKIANLEKNILISKVNTQVALESRKMDDSLAIAAFQGEQSLQGLETEIDFATMKDDLTRYGFEIQKDLALMDRETQLAVSRLMADYKMELAKTERNANRENALLGSIATIGAAYLKYSSGGIA